MPFVSALLVLGVVGLVLVFKSATRWPIYLFGRNSRGKDGLHHFMFAIQNGEDVPLEQSFVVEVEITQDGATFETKTRQPHRADEKSAATGRGTSQPTSSEGKTNEECLVAAETGAKTAAETGSTDAAGKEEQELYIEPEVYVGGPAKLARAELNAERTRLVLESNRLPPLDTWIIQFQTTASPRNVALRLRPPGHDDLLGAHPPESRHWPWYLSPHVLRQNLDEESALPRKTPGWFFLIGTWMVVTSMYAFPLAFHDVSWLPFVHHFSEFDHKFDWWVILVLTVAAAVVFQRTRLEPYPVIQGYQDPIPLRIAPSRRTCGSEPPAPAPH